MEKEAEGDLVRGMPAFAAERPMEPEVEAAMGAEGRSLGDAQDAP